MKNLDYKYTSEPATEPVSIEEAKMHLRVDSCDEDLFIAGLIKGAREYCEEFQRRCYVNRTLTLTLQAPQCMIELPRSPLVSVQSITFYFEDGTSQVVDPLSYGVITDTEPGRCYLKSNFEWPEAPATSTLREHSPVVIAFTAGYGATPATVPQSVKQAMLLLVGHWYVNREDTVTGLMVSRVPKSTTALLQQLKVYQ